MNPALHTQNVRSFNQRSLTLRRKAGQLAHNTDADVAVICYKNDANNTQFAEYPKCYASCYQYSVGTCAKMGPFFYINQVANACHARQDSMINIRGTVNDMLNRRTRVSDISGLVVERERLFAAVERRRQRAAELTAAGAGDVWFEVTDDEDDEE